MGSTLGIDLYEQNVSKLTHCLARSNTMKVAFLTFSSRTQKYFQRMICQLEDAGHRTCRFFELNNSVPPQNSVQCTWTRFALRELETFSPDIVFLFNGYGWNAAPASSFIARQWQTIFVEMGWFPQRDNIYVDRMGTGGRSSLSCTDLGEKGDLDDAQVQIEFDRLLQKYRVDDRPDWLPRKYILIPLQLARDTAILWDSPYFKTMESLVDFAASVYSAKQLIVKTHPLALRPFKTTHLNVRIVEDDITTPTLLAHAERVIGINSTTLLEALLFLKPVAALGCGVASSSHVFFDKETCLQSPTKFLSFEPNIDRLKRTAVRLNRLQYEWQSGRGVALDRFLRIETLTPLNIGWRA
jgi:hypothetical protein